MSALWQRSPGGVAQARRRGKSWAIATLVLFAALVLLGGPQGNAAADNQDEDWHGVASEVTKKLSEASTAYQNNDVSGVETAIRQAYYESYQVSGLEDQIRHRLGRDVSSQFVDNLLGIRALARDGASQQDLDQAVGDVANELNSNVAALEDNPALEDQWTRVRDAIAEEVTAAQEAYKAGRTNAAYKHATDAYLAHYEAEGLEKATISYLGQGRVTEVEGYFRDIRQGAREDISEEEYDQRAATLMSAVDEDAAYLDRLNSGGGDLGWRAFLAPFLILLREGAEALLVVAAVVTYAMKAGRRDQLRGIIIGVIAAIVVSIAIAIGFTVLTSSAVSGFGQELIEGVTGVLAVIMLIYVAQWIFAKSNKHGWKDFLDNSMGEKTRVAGSLALASVAFLAVVREGAETILFYSPILAAAGTTTDYVMIWAGSGAAAILLAIAFALVWVFGVRLPMQQFFRWTSLLLGILAVTIAGNSVKELQDATVIPATPVSGVPSIQLLGLWPTAESLATQFVVAAIIVALVVWRARQNRQRERSAKTAVNTRGVDDRAMT